MTNCRVTDLHGSCITESVCLFQPFVQIIFGIYVQCPGYSTEDLVFTCTNSKTKHLSILKIVSSEYLHFHTYTYITRVESHLSISPLHHSHGCSRSYCGGQHHSVSNWSHVQCIGHAAARSLPCLHRILHHEGQIQLSHIPAPGTPRRPHGGPSRGRKQSPTGHGGAPQLCQNTCSPHPLV